MRITKDYKKCYAFAYGTLCDAKVRKDVIGHATESKSTAVKKF
jgi:hypothetical protein